MSPRLIRIFVASTFTEFQAERAILHDRIFPRVSDLCRAHGVVFQPIDLRWGVNEEAGSDQRTPDICLEEVRRCLAIGNRPSFLLMLGSDCGWCPLPSHIEPRPFQAIVSALQSLDSAPARRSASRLQRWYMLDRNAVPEAYRLRVRRGRSTRPEVWAALEQRLRAALWVGATRAKEPALREMVTPRSMTELEVEAGLLSQPPPRDHCIAVFRNLAPGESPDIPAADTALDADGATDLAAVRKARWSDLKARVRVSAAAQLLDFAVAGDIGSLPPDYFRAFETRVADALFHSVQEQIDLFDARVNEGSDADEHMRIRERLASTYIARTDFEARLWSELDPANGHDDSACHPLVIVGPSGSGKSALIGALSRRAERLDPTARHVCRFVGATRRSANSGQLVADILPPAAGTASDRRPIVTVVRHWLEHDAENLWLFVDAVDRLEAAQIPSSAVDWLPIRIGPRTRVVISVTEGAVADHLRTLLPADAIFDMVSLTTEEASQIVTRHLSLQRRTLQSAQRAAVVAAALASTGQPLYLRLAAYIATRWNHEVDATAQLPSRIEDLIVTALDSIRATGYHGRDVTSQVLAQIAAAPFGISEEEIIEHLERDARLLAEFVDAHKASPRLDSVPPIVWYRIAGDLRELLAERSVDDVVTLSFLHLSIQDAVKQRSGPLELARAHRDLAALYADQQLYPRWRVHAGERQPNRRAIRVLPFHLACGGVESRTELSALLEDFDFLMARCHAGQVDELLEDVERACEVLGDASVTLQLLRGLLKTNIHLLRRGNREWPAHRILLQIASEMDVDHPVRRAADGWLQSGNCNWYWLRNVWTRPHLPGLIALQGHTGSPRGFMVVCDRGVSWSEDGSIRSWDLETGQMLREFLGHTGPVHAVIPLLPNEQLLSWSSDGTVRLWDLASARELAQMRPHAGEITSLHLLSGNRFLSVSRADQALAVWSLTTRKPDVVMDMSAPARDGSLHVLQGARGDRQLRDDLYVPMQTFGVPTHTPLPTGGVLQLDDDHLLTWQMIGAAVWSIAYGGRIAEADWFPGEELQFVVPARGTATVKVLAGSGAEFEWDWSAQTAHRVRHGSHRGGISALDGQRLFTWTRVSTDGDHRDLTREVDYAIVDRHTGATERDGRLHNEQPEDPSYFRRAQSLVPRGLLRLDADRLCAWSGSGIDLVDLSAGRIKSVCRFGLENFVDSCVLVSPSRLLLLVAQSPQLIDLERKEVVWTSRGSFNAIMHIDAAAPGRVVLYDRNGTLWIWNVQELGGSAAGADPDFGSTALLNVSKCSAVGYGLVAANYDHPAAAPYVDILQIYPRIEPLKRVTHPILEAAEGAASARIDTLGQLILSWSNTDRIHLTEAESAIEMQIPIPRASSVSTAILFYCGSSDLPPFGVAREEVRIAVLGSDGAVLVCMPFGSGFESLQRSPGADTKQAHGQLSFEHQRWLLLFQTRSVEMWDLSGPGSVAARVPAASLSLPNEEARSERVKHTIVGACSLPAGGAAIVIHGSQELPGYRSVEDFSVVHLRADGSTHSVWRSTLRVQLYCAVDDRRVLCTANGREILTCDLQSGTTAVAATLMTQALSLKRTGQAFVIEHDDGNVSHWLPAEQPDGVLALLPRLDIEKPWLQTQRGAILLRTRNRSEAVAQWHDSLAARPVCTLETGSFIVLLSNGMLIQLQALYGKEYADLAHVEQAPQPPSHAWLARSRIFDYVIGDQLEGAHHTLRVRALSRAHKVLTEIRGAFEKRRISTQVLERWFGEMTRTVWAIGSLEDTKALMEFHKKATALRASDGGRLHPFDRDCTALLIAVAAEAAASNLAEQVDLLVRDLHDAFEPEHGVVAAAARLLRWNLACLAGIPAAAAICGRRRPALRQLASLAATRVDHPFWRELAAWPEPAASTPPSSLQAPAQTFAGAAELDDPDHYPEAKRATLQRALQGNEEAMLSLGRMFGLGESGAARNARRAAAWYQRASERGSALAPLSLAQMYRHGELTGAPDPAAAVPWMELAAERGNVMAQTNLGNALMTGTGIAKDVARARVLLEKSVAAGDVIACFPLAISYFYGEGGAKDVVRAEQVAAEGARKGDPNCARFLRMIRNARTQQALQPDAPTPTANSTDGDSLKPALKAALAHWEEQRRSGDEAQAAALADALLAEIDEQVIAAADHETLVTVVFVLHETAGHRIQDAADPATALPSSQLAIRAGERLVFATGAYQHYPLLGAIYMNHGALLRSLKQDAEALAFQRRGVAGFQRIPDAHMTPKLLGYLMGALVNLADTSAALKQFSVAEAEYSAAMPRLRSAVSSGPTELAGLLAHLDGMHTGLKLESGTTTTAAAAHVEERLAAWLAADAPWHGEKWEAAIRKLIQLARNLRESVLGTAAAEEAAAAWLRALDGLRSRQRV